MMKVSSAFEAGASSLKRNETRQRFNLPEPRKHSWITRQIYVSFRCPFHVAVKRDVGNTGFVRAGDPALRLQSFFHHNQACMRTFNHFLRVERRAENGDEPSSTSAIGDLAGRDRKP